MCAGATGLLSWLHSRPVGGNKIGRVTTSGAFTEYSVPTPDASPTDIVAGPDGALWFSEQRSHKIGRVTTSGRFTEFPVSASRKGSPFQIIVGPDKSYGRRMAETAADLCEHVLHALPDRNLDE